MISTSAQLRTDLLVLSRVVPTGSPHSSWDCFKSIRIPSVTSAPWVQLSDNSSLASLSGKFKKRVSSTSSLTRFRRIARTERSFIETPGFVLRNDMKSRRPIERSRLELLEGEALKERGIPQQLQFF
jgi:hypothetical protein